MKQRFLRAPSRSQISSNKQFIINSLRICCISRLQLTRASSTLRSQTCCLGYVRVHQPLDDDDVAPLPVQTGVSPIGPDLTESAGRYQLSAGEILGEDA